ncbi:MAG: FAD-dependent oxidoreductase [Chthoniobacterales bacterium]
MNEPKIAIVGAGVSGLSCGVLVAEAGYGATIFADQLGQQTTSAAAGAIWFPYDAEPLEAVIAWSLTTFRRLCELASEAANGVSMMELRQFARGGEVPLPSWSHSLGARVLPRNHVPECFASGYTLTVPLTDTTVYLDYLRKRFDCSGGTVHETHLENLEDIPPDYAVVINCAGIGARELAQDSALEPHRGQVVLVENPDLPYAVVSDDPPLMYAIPRRDDCVFGGTNELSGNRAVDPEETTRILHECCRVLGIASPRVLGERVGLRPYRASGVRLAREQLRDGRVVIHNYGHGGSGFTLSWGCAEEVLALARAAIAGR